MFTNHVRSSKHKLGLVKRESSERDIASAFSAAQGSHPRGETLPKDQRIYNVKVVKVFLQTGTPLDNVDQF